MAKKDNKTKIQKPEAALQTDAAQITATGRVIAEHPSNFITPQKMRALFEDAESGDIRAQHELFADIEERDSDIAANMGTRKRALLTLNWRVAPPRNATPEEEKLSDQAYEMMDSLPTLEDLIMDLMDAVGHGFSALEVEWVFSDGLYLPRNFIHRPQSWFKWDKDDGLLLRTRENPEGEALWPLGWVVHTQKSRSVRQARNGLFRSLSWLYMFKHYAVHDFAEFLELYGMPIRIGKYGAGATKEEKKHPASSGGGNRSQRGRHHARRYGNRAAQRCKRYDGNQQSVFADGRLVRKIGGAADFGANADQRCGRKIQHQRAGQYPQRGTPRFAGVGRKTGGANHHKPNHRTVPANQLSPCRPKPRAEI